MIETKSMDPEKLIRSSRLQSRIRTSLTGSFTKRA